MLRMPCRLRSQISSTTTSMQRLQSLSQSSQQPSSSSTEANVHGSSSKGDRNAVAVSHQLQAAHSRVLSRMNSLGLGSSGVQDASAGSSSHSQPNTSDNPGSIRSSSKQADALSSVGAVAVVQVNQAASRPGTANKRVAGNGQRERCLPPTGFVV